LKEGLTHTGRYIAPLDVNLGPEHNHLRSLIDGGGYGEDVREIQPASEERDTLNLILRNIANENEYTNMKAYILFYKGDASKDVLNPERALLGYHGDSIPIDAGNPGAVRIQLPLAGLASFRFKNFKLNPTKTGYTSIRDSHAVEFVSVPGQINVLNRFECGQLPIIGNDVFTHHGIFQPSRKQLIDNADINTNCRASLIATFYGKSTNLNAPVVISEAAVGAIEHVNDQVRNASDFCYHNLTDSALCHLCDGDASAIHYTPLSEEGSGAKRKLTSVDNFYQPNTCVNCFDQVN